MEVNDVLQTSSISKQHYLHIYSDMLLGIYLIMSAHHIYYFSHWKN